MSDDILISLKDSMYCVINIDEDIIVLRLKVTAHESFTIRFYFEFFSSNMKS